MNFRLSGVLVTGGAGFIGSHLVKQMGSTVDPLDPSDCDICANGVKSTIDP